MNVLDIIILTILLIAFVRGVIKGLFVEVAGILAIIIGVYVAINYSYEVAYYLKQSVVDWSDQTYNIVAFIVTFLLVALIIVFIGNLLTKLADITALGLVNKILGGIFGALKVALILSVCFLIFEKINNTATFVEEETLQDSKFYLPVKNISLLIFPAIIDTNKEGDHEFKVPGQFK